MNANGQLRLVEAGRECRPSEFAISGNQQDGRVPPPATASHFVSSSQLMMIQVGGFS